MRVISTHDPEVMRIDDDSILFRMFGFVAILAAVAFWPIYLNAQAEPGTAPGVWGLMLVLGGALVCALFGLTMMLYSGQTIIDRRLGKVVHWQRLLWWRPTSEHQLEDFHRVIIVQSGRPAYRTWGIEIQTDPPDPARTVLCGLGLARQDAEALAEQLADFAGWSLENRSGAVVR